MKEEKEEETKPITGFAPPPVSAVVSIAAFMSASFYYFPTIENPDATIFTNRVFPDLLSIEALLGLRIFFAFTCLCVFIMAWFYPSVTIQPPYRPKSKVPRIPFTIGGWKKHYSFTACSWNLLGISFALNSYITYQLHYNPNQSIPDSLVRVAIILWETTAPMTLQIGATVKYALWPAQVKQFGHGGPLLLARPLLQHNANVVMAMSEVALMGGLPVAFSHIPIPVLYGCFYVLFTWAIQLTWHGQGPAFLYFFMDTTLGMEHTISLHALLTVLMVFHSIFSGIETLLHMVGNNLLGHAGLGLALCSLVCKFRD